MAYGSKAQVGNAGLTLDDAEAIRREFPGLYMVSPIANKYEDIQHKTFASGESIQGITMEWIRRDWDYIGIKGRFLNQHDIDNYARVCVVVKAGGWLKKPKWFKFYGWQDDFQNYIKHNDLLGETIRIGEHLYTVVGILEQPPMERRAGLMMRGWGAGDIYAPITTVQRFMEAWNSSGRAVDGINVDTGSEATINAYKNKIEKLLTVRHGGRAGFEIKDYRELIKEQLADQQRSMYTVLIIGAIAILAGGIGIMNVTLATIYSRIKEIGIRRAIGATRWDIMAQFMIEAMLLGFFGGVAGILVGLSGIQYLVSKGSTEMMVQWWMPFVAIFMAVFTGFLASLYPAYQASRLDPVEALRYE